MGSTHRIFNEDCGRCGDFNKLSLLGINVAYVAFINDSDDNTTLPIPTSTFINLSWMQYQALIITSPSTSELHVQLADPSASVNVDSFTLSLIASVRKLMLLLDSKEIMSDQSMLHFTISTLLKNAEMS